jgi:hypothetical protein
MTPEQWIQLVAGIATPLIMSTPQGQKLGLPLATAITSGIIAAERLFRKGNGAQKKAQIETLTRTAVAVANATGDVEIDPVEAVEAAGQGVDLVVKVANLARDAKK